MREKEKVTIVRYKGEELWYKGEELKCGNIIKRVKEGKVLWSESVEGVVYKSE